MVYCRGGQHIQPVGHKSNSYAARHVPEGKKLYGWILCVPLLELWVRPATKIKTLFWPTVVKSLPTAGLLSVGKGCIIMFIVMVKLCSGDKCQTLRCLCKRLYICKDGFILEATDSLCCPLTFTILFLWFPTKWFFLNIFTFSFVTQLHVVI